jgi:hypothetical protein
MMELILALRGFLDTVKGIGGDARELRVDPPATEDEIERVEQELGISIPSELRRAMLDVSAHLEFSWFLPDSFELPQILREIFCGELHWGLDLVPKFIEEYQGWIKEVFPNPDNPYDAIWHGKFPFQDVGNGDYIAIDEGGQVIYLSHDDGEGHGYIMADSFNDLLARWVPLGCVGGEDWQWLPFTNGMTTRIDPKSEAARTWMLLLGRSQEM